MWFYSEPTDLQDLQNEKKFILLNKYLNEKNFNLNLKNKIIKKNKIVDNLILNNFKIRKSEKNFFLKDIFKLNNIRYFITYYTNDFIKLAKIPKPKINSKLLSDMYQIILKAKNI